MTDGTGVAVENTAQSYSQGADNAAEQQEKLIPQSHVDEIVKRVKSQAVEQYKKLYSEQPEYAQRKYGDPAPANAQANHNTSSGSYDEDRFRKMAAEEAQRMRDEIYQQAQEKQQEEQANKIVQSFYQKINASKDGYDDFDKVTGDLNFQSFPNTVQILAEYVDNSGDLLYEFGKDRMKLAQLEMLANMSPNDAIAQAQRLSTAIKERKAAQTQNTKNPRQPLSQLQPNVNGSAGNTLDWTELSRQWTA